MDWGSSEWRTIMNPLPKIDGVDDGMVIHEFVFSFSDFIFFVIEIVDLLE